MLIVLHTQLTERRSRVHFTGHSASGEGQPGRELIDIISPGGTTAIHRCHNKGEYKMRCPPIYELFDKFEPHLLARRKYSSTSCCMQLWIEMEVKPMSDRDVSIIYGSRYIMYDTKSCLWVLSFFGRHVASWATAMHSYRRARRKCLLTISCALSGQHFCVHVKF